MKPELLLMPLMVPIAAAITLVALVCVIVIFARTLTNWLVNRD